MLEQQKLKLAAILYKYAFPIYRWMYFNFKTKKDGHNIQFLQRIIKPGFTILDIGANIGFFSRFFSEQVGPNGKVYCFEPDITNFRHLKNEMNSIANVSLHQKAVAAQNGMLTLYTSDLLNIDHRTYEPESYTSKYTVEKISIDEFVNNKFKIDFIKMDIQGFEMEALEGMKQTLAANHDIIILTEFWPFGLQKAGTSAVAMFDFFTSLNFNIYLVEEIKLSKLSRAEVAAMKVEYFSDSNILVTKNDLAAL